jgi:hypothetical protein
LKLAEKQISVVLTDIEATILIQEWGDEAWA